MTINVSNIKEKILTRFDKTVKMATTRAIPIMKKEAIKHITTSSMSYDSLVKIITAVAFVTTTIGTRKTIQTSAEVLSKPQTIINIETLNLWG